ncbi:MAG TPA: NFACT RNA binding domain-containing protein, partial [Ktedonobacteraceae bacterium]|nr:NFACT RNA binding domain-containing protein [Ktedonobacteraceae bacterium]
LALQCYTPGVQGEGGQSGQSGHNHWLYLSAHPQFARAHITALKPPKIASEPPPFVMLLRKYLEGARIESIQQPRWERVIEIIAGYRSDPESDERIHFRLIIEIMGRLSNIIFCDEQGMILGSLKRVGSDVNRYRTIAANVPYIPPPPQQRLYLGQTVPKLEPITISADQLALCAADETTVETPVAETSQTPQAKKKRLKPQDSMLWQVLTRHLLGISPLMAREAVYRTTGNGETLIKSDDVWEELAWNMRELATLYDTRRWQPQLVEQVKTSEESAAGQKLPLAFAPYVLEQYAETPDVRIHHSPSMNVILDDYYARIEWRDAMEGVRSPIRKVLQTQRDRCIRKAAMLQQEMAQAEEAARYRLQAELLLAHQNDVHQGQATVTLHNFYLDEEQQDEHSDVTITLDPRFDAVGNANRMFNKYHKLRRATALVPHQIEQNAVELATIEQLLADLMLAENPAEVVLVKAEVQAAGYMRGAKVPDKKAQKAAKKAKGGKAGKSAKGKATPPGGGVPLNLKSHDGFTLLIGKNSRQNEEVTFHQATANDIWLHARGFPGAHVIIKAAGRDIPHGTIEQAASLAAYYSQARGSTTAPVDYTFQRHVRHMKGGGPGMVIYDHERTIYAVPVMA